MSMDNQHTIKLKLIDIKDQLPKKQKKLCDYILKNFQSLGLVTIKELSQDADVGISTVMRTLKAIGYENFNDFKKDIYEEVMPSESTWVMQTSLMDSVEKNKTLVDVWDKSVELLNKSYNEELDEYFKDAVKLMKEAEMIGIIGTRPYKAASLYLEQLLGEFTNQIAQLSHDTETVIDKVLQMGNRDLIVMFAFEPYSQLVSKVAKIAHNNQVPILLITDYDSCPIVQYASETLKLAVSKNHFSILPIIALIDAIVIEMGKYKSEQSVDKLKRLEKTLKDYDII
ncbi:MurR/RpiR family transcriptional regulator [Mammaliicoccus sciuri]|uniref:MurR/RpiR family transcriptional regulator n=2 Tax=Staphylococcaceae TaxID=90964 RepID=A0AAI8GSR9_MAMSC|nr:MurR/RpiR family transcriptional regulator [Mammaliicoccus sciuri]MBO3078887.1 MurR/RpiR family transcriptional regulator [Mammaliicoccus sciuri]MCD8777614.1 MurR/RpiR family transcriptional regulator [Mammaliicoccus sciuri]MCD8780073.1 MurR/RpiR family transcriptional regulator [Mammaliicoccus sciuri]MCD8802935.1 MurR/RpiR family transcriptional regulator [Mammaliicoccus sciuri]